LYDEKLDWRWTAAYKDEMSTIKKINHYKKSKIYISI